MSAALSAKLTRHGRIWRPDFANVSAVYRLFHMVTGETYVGATKHLAHRAREHAAGTSMTYPMKDCICRSGDLFRMEVIELCPVEKLTERESYWIKRLSPALNTMSRAWATSSGARASKSRRKRSEKMDSRRKTLCLARSKPSLIAAFKDEHPNLLGRLFWTKPSAPSPEVP